MKDDYSDVVFSPGLVCFNINNNALCVVIDGKRGSTTDRASLVMEINREAFLTINTPPNRALKPTGKIFNIKHLTTILRDHVIL